MNRFTWDYPTHGLRTPRTLVEAFGPYTKPELLPPPEPAKFDWDGVCIVVGVLVFLLVTLVPWWVG